MLCIRGALLLLLFSTVLSTPAHAAKAPIPSFQVTVAASPADVQVKKTETLTATATSNINASDYNILFTVTLNGTQVASHSFTDFDFTADEPVTQTFDWTVPAKAASGAYVVTVEVKKDGDSYGSGTAGFTVGAAAAACGSTPSGSTETETLGTTFGSIAAVSLWRHAADNDYRDPGRALHQWHAGRSGIAG